MVEKKTTKKAVAAKTTEVAKKPATRKTAAKKEVVALNAENAGFKAGDVYQTLAAAGKPLAVKEIAKEAKISEGEALLGMGWLFKEGKIVAAENDTIALA